MVGNWDGLPKEEVEIVEAPMLERGTDVRGYPRERPRL